MKLISIIVPVYNVEKYLSECLDSLINQTYKNIEIICINDGSTDESGKICDEYSKKYKNIFVVHKKNEGLGFARNTGMNHVKGDYVLFVDSDDYIDKDMVEKLFNSISKNKVDICRCGYKKVDNQHNILFKDVLENELFKGKEVKTKMLPRLIGSSPKIKDTIDMSVTRVLYNFSIIKQHHIKFPSEREFISEDMVFNIDYTQYANGACIIDYCGYNYRSNPVSLTRKYRQDRFNAAKYFYVNVKQKLISYGYKQDTLDRLSRNFFILLKMSISQENKNVSKNKISKSLKIIKNICKDKIVLEVINEYPIKKLGLKQKIFLYMIKYNLNILLYVFAMLNMI